MRNQSFSPSIEKRKKVWKRIVVFVFEVRILVDTEVRIATILGSATVSFFDGAAVGLV